MKTNRLVILMAIMLTLVFLRFAFPPKAGEYATVEPVTSRSQMPRPSLAVVPTKDERASASDEDVPGNAFSVRVVAPPPAPPPLVIAPVVAVPAAPVVSAQDLAAQAPVPLQVIGTYDDGGAPAVFVATAMGTLIARPGTVLLAEYRVTAITSLQVSLTQVSTQRAIQLSIPGRAAR